MDRAPSAVTDDFEERFRNWVRWCRDVFNQRGRAGSAEGAYRSPQHWEPPEPNMKLLDPIIDWDALLVNRAYWQLGEKTRRTIKILWFRRSWGPERQARKIGIHKSKLEEVAELSKKMLSNRLRFVENRRSISR